MIMSYLELFVIAVGLSMDAFAVSICKGLSVRRLKPRHNLICGLYFGGFQALMPVIGWLLGRQFESLIKSIDHWIAFALLVLIGANMIREAVKNEEENLNDSFSPKTMLPLAVATSIDALAVGVTFAFLDVSIVPAVSMIGATTFILSAVGVKIGNVFGAKYKSKAELVGGIVLIAMGVKILIEHLFFD
ncbi:manganese efflux pump MntP family protein [uncultured Ruminococcus sp.]|uniref:manganese efflux pump MntP n=1 Tax=Ruminococcus sp. JE7B6 TaxID=3233380 RepID=UPI0037DBF7D2